MREIHAFLKSATGVFLENRDGTVSAKFHLTMKNPLSRAFTLVELLTVIAIVGILVALLLPALEGGKSRAKLVGCQSNLGQLGLAFHSFAHDHGSRFPMQVSVAQGGAQEFVQNGYRMNQEFYFAFRIFQPLSDDLGTTKILICPTDTRLPATNFISLRNINLICFVGVNADYNQPESVLLGDRNLIAGPSRSIYQANGQPLRWSETMHRFKGNLLFADGHVEEAKSFSLAGSRDGTSGTGGSGVQNNFFIPSVKAEETAAQPVLASPATTNNTGNARTNSAAPDKSNPTNQPACREPAVFLGQSNARNSSTANPMTPGVADESKTNPGVTNGVAIQISTNTAAPPDEDSGMSSFDRRIAHFLRHVIFGTYLLILLMFLLFMAYRIWRWTQDPERKHRR